MSHLNKFILKCHENLIGGNSYEARKAGGYLNDRNVTPKSINVHKIGYCNWGEDIPDEIRFFSNRKEDIDADKKDYSYFIKGRLIVPIYSEFSRVVGFATRKPSHEKGNTWWNISKPFHKSEHLFLLDKARQNIFKKDKIYLVEGYIDAIVLHQEGIEEVVGLMGTSLSPRQVGLIARYCSNICLCLDKDENQAGQKAQGKVIYSLKKFDFYNSISIIDGMTIGEDPDVFVSMNGTEALRKMEKVLSTVEINKIAKQVEHDLKRG